MATTIISRALAEAYDRPDPREAIWRAKQVVSSEFRRADPSLNVHTTEYFNHSIAPDLVLRWSREGHRERYVFLRESPTSDDYLQDIVHLGRLHPILLGLSSLEDGGSEDPLGNTVDSESRESDTLVTDADGLHQIAQRRSSEPVIGLMATALVQGGRGLVDEARADEITNAVAAGFDGAKEASVDPTSRATGVIESALTSVQASRMSRFLQAVWEGSLGRTEDFPSSFTNLSGILEDEALEFLLASQHIDDLEFWNRLGRRISIDQISRLHLPSMSQNLQYLIKANLDVLIAKSCHIKNDQGRLDEADPTGMRWVVEQASLALRSERFTAYLATSVATLPMEPDESDGVPVLQLRERAGRRNIRITEVKIGNAARTLSYDSARTADVVQDEALTAFADAMGPETRAQSAIALVPGGKRLACSFVSSTATGPTRTTFPIADLLRTAVPLLKDLTNAEEAELVDLTTFPYAQQDLLLLAEAEQVTELERIWSAPLELEAAPPPQVADEPDDETPIDT